MNVGDTDMTAGWGRVGWVVRRRLAGSDDLASTSCVSSR